MFFDTLCKWHEDVHKHNYIGYLVDCGEKMSEIYNKLSHSQSLTDLIKANLKLSCIEDLEELSYQERESFNKIRKILLLFNVLTCDKFGQKFPF